MAVLAADVWRQRGWRPRIAAALAAGAITTAAAAQEARSPRLETNQGYVEETTRADDLAVGNPMAVFAFVLNSLPDQVKVYPTENYFYFRFVHAGTPYAGNIRLDPRDRDRGKVQFSYYKDASDWADEAKDVVFLTLDEARGVRVEHIEALSYRISYNGKSVVFALNDLSAVKPPPTALGPDEQFLGPIFDESAFRFFFLFNPKLKLFHFVLDETTAVPDDLAPAKRTDRLLIGRRTGFAFYRDLRLDRKILIGAFEVNSRINNYFDGPFDQLPENFIAGEALRQAIIAVDPSTRGRIDRLGNYDDGGGRFLVHPYVLYRNERELYRIDTCARGKVRSAAYYRCFVNNPEDARGPGGGRRR